MLALAQRSRGNLLEPRSRRSQTGIDVLYVANALTLQPFLQCQRSVLRKHGYAVLPNGAPAKHATESGTGLGGYRKYVCKRLVAYPFRKIDEWKCGRLRGAQKI